MTVLEEKEIMFQEIEKHFMVKDFLESINANVKSPDERELDMLWRWLLKRKPFAKVISGGNPITKTHLAIYMKDVFKDDWYLKFKKSK
tara:strand:- start:161 stop:424 length:264 start_codon:yes stop_codon:yes gene_type:complete